MASKRFLVCDRDDSKMIGLPDYDGDRNYDDTYINFVKNELCHNCMYKCKPVVRFSYRKKEG